MRRQCIVGLLLALSPLGADARAGDLPVGYLVWTKGVPDDPASRKIARATLPGMTAPLALTSGEDIEPRISPDGQWVAYAKAKFPGGSDYHDFKLWRPYIVSIHGAGEGRKEIKIDDDGAWPSWGAGGALFYNQADGTHSRVVRVELDALGRVARKQIWLTTKDVFAEFGELNECFVSPDERWFAGRTRGNVNQNGVSAFTPSPPQSILLARAGSIGCMPFVAPGGTFGIIAGAGAGIRWGHSPFVAARIEDKQLIAPLTVDHLAYHPGISSDEKWVLVAQGTDTDHNAGRYDVYIHPLDTVTMVAGVGQALATGGFNGWPHVWVGTPSPPPPPQPSIAEFYPSSYTVAPGEAVTLTWSTFGSDQVILDSVAMAVDGTVEVAPMETRSYSLTAGSTLVDGSETRVVTIQVNATPLPVAIAAFAANPARVAKGGSTTLSWEALNATTLDLDGARVAPIETREVTPAVTTTYVLSAQGAGGPVEARVTVVVDKAETGLLPDRGGFVCALAKSWGRGGWTGLGTGGLFLCLVAFGWRRARGRR
jgi:hypothetical protein